MVLYSVDYGSMSVLYIFKKLNWKQWKGKKHKNEIKLKQTIITFLNEQWDPSDKRIKMRMKKESK